jgi:uncharacterized protein (TIGR02145 family)
MKTMRNFKIIFGFIALFILVACAENEDEDTNIPPNVSFITPTEDIAVAIGDVVDIAVAADDPDGQIDTVYIEFNGENIAQITSIPYEFTMTTFDLEPGIYELKAIASDNLGALSTSTTIIVDVSAFLITPPSVETIPPTYVGLFGANVTTEYTDFGTFGADVIGLCWGLSQNPTYDGTGTNFQIANNGYDIDDLEPGNTYYFRAFATYYDSLDFDTTSVSYGDNVEVTLSSDFYTETGMFTDDRDGEIYNWVTINGQTWMAENLRLADCEGYADLNDTNAYGKLPCYSCPDGWAIPTRDEYFQLINYLGGTNRAGKYLKANDSSFWNTNNATNETLFSALPGGYKFAFDIEDPVEYEVGEYGYYLFSFDGSQGQGTSGYVKFNDGNGLSTTINELGEPTRSVSMRCIKIN